MRGEDHDDRRLLFGKLRHQQRARDGIPCPGIGIHLVLGNHFDAEVETTRYDASNGLLLLGDGGLSYESQNALYSGFYVPGNAKEMVQIEMENGLKVIVVGNNNQQTSVFAWR